MARSCSGQTAKGFAEGLDPTSLLKRRVYASRGIDGAGECYAMAQELRGLASDFAKWPDLSRELVAISRSTHVPRLLELERNVEEVMGSR